MNASVKALENFDSGYNCAESVLLAVASELRISGPDYLPRIATGFGGGIARNGSVCGALTGGIMALGLALGRDNSAQNREPCYPAVDTLYAGFAERFGSTQCRNLIAADLKTPEGRKAHDQKEIRDLCRSCVGWSAERTMDIAGEFSQGPKNSA